MYKSPAKTGDMVNDYIKGLCEFTRLSHALLEAKTRMQFEVQFELLEKIDRRTLYLFILTHKKQIPIDYLRTIRHDFWDLR